MMNELELLTAAASTPVFIQLSLVFVLAYAAWLVWLTGRTPVPSIIRRAP
jgi:ABC-type nickel/cobalt efflux system permease component RcnA